MRSALEALFAFEGPKMHLHMSSVNIVVLAAGHVDFETRDGGYPLGLLEIDGVSVLEHIVSRASKIANARFTFALREDDVARYHLDKVVHLLVPACKVVKVRNVTRGSACTALLATSGLPQEEELLIISANELVETDLAQVLSEFRGRALDGGVITFPSVHPRYSYVKLDANGLVTQASQQMPISKNATTGVFWFARVASFLEAAKDMVRKDAHVGGNYYIAKAYNELLLRRKRVGAVQLGSGKYRPLKTERHALQAEHVELPA